MNSTNLDHIFIECVPKLAPWGWECGSVLEHLPTLHQGGKKKIQPQISVKSLYCPQAIIFFKSWQENACWISVQLHWGTILYLHIV
jgi:hypothetical protein